MNFVMQKFSASKHLGLPTIDHASVQFKSPVHIHHYVYKLHCIRP